MKSEPLEELDLVPPLADYSEIPMRVGIDHICKLTHGDLDETFD